MWTYNLRSFSAFLRVNKSIAFTPQCSLFKYYHSKAGKTIQKYLIDWKYSKNNYKAISVTAAAGLGAYACSVAFKMSEPLIEEENEDEFDKLFIQESLKEDVELLRKFGPVPFLLIGATPATIAAYRAIRIKDPTVKVLMVSEEVCDPYNPSPLSSELWYRKNLDPAAKRKWIFYNDYYLSLREILENKNGGLALIRGSRVVKIDPVSQIVVFDTGEHISYEKCLLDAGTKPKNLPVFQEAKRDIQKHLSIFHSIHDFVKLEKISRKVKSIAVVGGGFLGSELASGLKEYNRMTDLNVIQIFPEPDHFSNILPQYLREWITKKFQNRGIHVVPGVTVKAVSKNDNKIELHLSNDKIISVDHVVVALGSEPNIEIALSSGLESDDKQGFLVNAEMKARKNLWIAGNATSFYDIQLGRRRVDYHEDAILSGRAAGENMVGNEKAFHYQSNCWSVLGSDIFFEGIGDIDAKLQTTGIFVQTPTNKTLEPAYEMSNDVSKTGQNINENSRLPKQTDSDCYKKGIVFYLKDNIIVGILLWNVADTKIAKQIIEECRSPEEVIEISRLFQLSPTENKENSVI